MVAQHHTAALTALLLALPAPGQQGEDVPLAGVVVDPRGRAIAGAKLGTSWWFDWQRAWACGSQQVWPAESSRDKNRGEGGWNFVVTGADGRFDARLLPERRSKKLQLVVFSADLELGGVFVWEPGEELGGLRLVLQPVSRFRATLSCDALGRSAVAATGYLRAYDGRRLGRFKADRGVVDLRLPAGHYGLYVYGADKQDVEPRLFPFAVSSGEDARARDIDLEPNWIARNRGRAIPLWRATAARGLPLAGTDYASFAGKWLLVHMWNCESVEPGRDIPELMRFDQAWRREHPEQDPPYRIVLLHSGGAKTFEELDEQIAHLQLRENHWGGQPLPFPVLLDPAEQTGEVWRTRWRRATLLFDPRGRLWGDTDCHGDLARAVAGELAPAVPARPKKK